MSMNAEEVVKILTDRFRPYVGMLFFAPTNQITPTTIRFNGTVAFIDTGSSKLIITNDHVYRRRRRRNGFAVHADIITGEGRIDYGLIP
jgi:hypothetical protein